MWGSNWFWNIVLLWLWVWLAALSFGVFMTTDTFLANIAGPDSKIVAQKSDNFGTASFDWATVSYTDGAGVTSEYIGDEQIQDFCIDMLGR